VTDLLVSTFCGFTRLRAHPHQTSVSVLDWLWLEVGSGAWWESCLCSGGGGSGWPWHWPSSLGTSSGSDFCMQTTPGDWCCDLGLGGVGVAGIWCQLILFWEVMFRVLRSGGFFVDVEKAMPRRRGTLQ